MEGQITVHERGQARDKLGEAERRSRVKSRWSTEALGGSTKETKKLCSPRLGEVLLYTLSFALGIAVPAVIVRRDLARLQGERLARAWPDASLWLAVVVFGPLCVPIHFIRTRRSWAGLLLALLWFGGAMLAVSLPVWLFGLIFGIAD